MLIDNTPFREAFLRSDLPLNQLARELELDRESLRRSLGLAPSRTVVAGKPYIKNARRMSERLGLRLLEPLGLDPHEVGL